MSVREGKGVTPPSSVQVLSRFCVREGTSPGSGLGWGGIPLVQSWVPPPPPHSQDRTERGVVPSSNIGGLTWGGPPPPSTRGLHPGDIPSLLIQWNYPGGRRTFLFVCLFFFFCFFVCKFPFPNAHVISLKTVFTQIKSDLFNSCTFEVVIIIIIFIRISVHVSTTRINDIYVHVILITFTRFRPSQVIFDYT